MTTQCTPKPDWQPKPPYSLARTVWDSFSAPTQWDKPPNTVETLWDLNLLNDWQPDCRG